MTREEAIGWLKVINTKEFAWDEYAMQESQREIRERCEQGVREAIDMAIEALHREEAEEKGYCHRIKPKNDCNCDGRKEPLNGKSADIVIIDERREE